jgi:hypothetical protein
MFSRRQLSTIDTIAATRGAASLLPIVDPVLSVMEGFP